MDYIMEVCAKDEKNNILFVVKNFSNSMQKIKNFISNELGLEDNIYYEIKISSIETYINVENIILDKKLEKSDLWESILSCF